uniref:Uncharacterized protein n=1 Tax=Lactuca sativa TaxID=4236 RepID=A0A9R1XKF0_LACSA|nr:hypothetical protein LSAT_V11C300107810 [Lactuca sativa]
MQKKCNAFNCIYNRKMNSVPSRRSKVDVLKASQSEYRRTINQKAFPHEKNLGSDSLRKIKGKKTASSSSTQMKCLISSTKLSASKLQMRNRDNSNGKKNYIENQDMQYFLQLCGHLTGGILCTVLERKRQIATKYGWEL